MTVSAGSMISGSNPLSDSLALFTIQVLVILAITRALYIPLRYLRQPPVISEIIGGILLGPSALGRIPAFKDNVFPTASLPYLSLVANFGLVFFLFLVGLELNPKMLTRNGKSAIYISLAGMVLPFAVGVAVSYGLYSLLADRDSIKFSTFLLFTGVSMSITAFPVLARILGELNLFKTRAGVIAISSAAIDDITSWVLLALVISIINAASSLSILWILLVSIAYVAFVIFVVRPLYVKLVVREKFLAEVGPSSQLLAVTFAMVLISSWFTSAIGIHAIFGGFLVGVIIPHEHGLAKKIAEKMEEFVAILFLPLYFALSGLRTEIGLLNDGVSWGYVVLVTVAAAGGKILGCTLVAKILKFSWRESLTLGFLMSCKGLVELIVLNIGLDAGVIDKRVFTIMVLMALITTFITTPLVMWVYPPKHQQIMQSSYPSTTNFQFRMLAGISRMSQVPGMAQLLCLLTNASERKNHLVSVVHLQRLSDRFSSMIGSTDHDTQVNPVTNALQTYASYYRLNMDYSFHVISENELANEIAERTVETEAELCVVPYESEEFVHSVLETVKGTVIVLADRGLVHAACRVLVVLIGDMNDTAVAHWGAALSSSVEMVNVHVSKESLAIDMQSSAQGASLSLGEAISKAKELTPKDMVVTSPHISKQLMAECSASMVVVRDRKHSPPSIVH